MMALRQIRLIALKEFGDRFRSGWVIACIVVWLGAGFWKFCRTDL